MEKLLNQLKEIVRCGKSYKGIHDKLYNRVERYNKTSETRYFIVDECGFWRNSEIVEQTDFYLYTSEGKEAEIGEMYEVNGKKASYKEASDAFELEVWGYKREY